METAKLLEELKGKIQDFTKTEEALEAELAKIRAQREGLEKAMEVIAGLWVENGKGRTEKTETPKPIPVPSVAPVEHKPVVHYKKKIGAQSLVLRLLYTGPAKYEDVYSMSNLGRAEFRFVMNRLKGGGLATLENGVIRLTENGTKKAKVFVENPGLLVLRTSPTVGKVV